MNIYNDLYDDAREFYGNVQFIKVDFKKKDEYTMYVEYGNVCKEKIIANEDCFAFYLNKYNFNTDRNTKVDFMIKATDKIVKEFIIENRSISSLKKQIIEPVVKTL